MKPHLGCVAMIFAGTLALAQTNPAYPASQNQPGMPASVSRSPRGLPFGQRGTRASKATVRQSKAPQILGLDFANAVVYGTGGLSADSVAVADVNGDGKPDLVVANYCADTGCATDGSVAVLLGNGDGTFKTAVAYDSGGMQADSVAVADMNGDGKPDLVVTNFCSNSTNCTNNGPGSVSVLLGNGDGTFQTAVVYDSGGETIFVAVGDLNGDGKPDVLVASCPGPVFACAPGSVGVLLGNGDGTLQTVVNYSSGADDPESLALADVNGDGKLDVLVSNEFSLPSLHGPSAVGVLLGNGDGTFQTAAAYDINGMGVTELAVADVNGDGKPDVVVTEQIIGNCTSSAAAVLLGNGDGTFQSELDFCSGVSGNSVAVADVNGDGKPDLAVAGGSTVGVLINTTAIVVVSPTSLDFGIQTLGATSAPQNVMLINTGNWNTTLNISSIGITGTNSAEFAQTNTCGPTLAPNASCQISITFTPAGAGTRSAAVKITDSAPGGPQTVALSGMGQDFSLAVSSQTSMTVTPGQVANYSVTVSPLNGFNQNVKLSCSGAPAQSTCTMTPSSVTLNGSASATANLAVLTTAASAGLTQPAGPPSNSMFASWVALCGTLGLALLIRMGRGRRAWRPQLLYGLAFLCLLSIAAIMSACGGGGSSRGGSGTPAGTYNLTVTGSFNSGSAKLTHTANLSLVVQ